MPNNSIFALILSLEQYQNSNLLSQKVCGRTMPEWIQNATAQFQRKTVVVSPEDDILTLFKTYKTDAAFTVITYVDMPLLTAKDITDAVDFCYRKNVPAVKLPRGWVFNTELVSKSESFPITEYRAAKADNYRVAFNNVELSKLRTAMQDRINQEHLKHGVIIITVFAGKILCWGQVIM